MLILYAPPSAPASVSTSIFKPMKKTGPEVLWQFKGESHLPLSPGHESVSSVTKEQGQGMEGLLQLSVCQERSDIPDPLREQIPSWLLHPVDKEHQD